VIALAADLVISKLKTSRMSKRMLFGNLKVVFDLLQTSWNCFYLLGSFPTWRP